MDESLEVGCGFVYRQLVGRQSVTNNHERIAGTEPVYCNYCRASNPDDSVYCRACGRTIELLSEQFENEAGQSGPGDAPDAVAAAAEILDSAPVAEPYIEDEVQREYAGMDDEELGQLKEAYESLRMPLPSGLQSELEIRAAVKWFEEHPKELDAAIEATNSARLDIKAVEDGLKTEEQEHLPYKMEFPPSKPQPGSNATAKEERAPGGTLRNWLQHGWDRLVQWGSMNRRQKTCLQVGFLLLVGATLFPPWTYSYRSGGLGLPRLPRLPTLAGSRSGSSTASSYGFLFQPPFGGARVDVNRLFVEWILIALVTSGLFLSQAKRPILKTIKQPEPLAGAGPNSMKGRSYFKLEFPGAPPDMVAHIDDHERVTIWDQGTPMPTGLTRKVAEASGWQFKTATEDAITRHTGLENPTTYRVGKLWQRKFVIPFVIALAIFTIGIAYYGSRRIARNLPQTEISKLVGDDAHITWGQFVWHAYNGSDFVLTEVSVSISVFDEKGNPIISDRVYRIPAYDFYPQQTNNLSTYVEFTLEKGQQWGFHVIGAKGRPE